MGSNIINTFICGLIITQLSNMMMQLIFKIFLNHMERHGLFTLLYYFIKFILLSYIIPIGYAFVCIFMIYKNTALRSQRILGYLDILSMTPAISYTLKIMFFVWVITLLIKIIKYRKILMDNKRLLQEAEDCSKVIQKIFDEISSKMNIHSKIKVKYTSNIINPGLVGVLKPTILLPKRRHYTLKEMEVIAYHEMRHYIQKDVFWRYIMMLVDCIYILNKEKLFYFLEEYSELSCDEHALRASGLTSAQYYMTIAEMSFHGKRYSFVSPLYENKNSLERRVSKMKFLSDKSHRAHSAFLSLFFICTITLFGTTSLAAEKVYSQLRDYTYVENVEDNMQEQNHLLEYTEDSDEFLDEAVIEISSLSRAQGIIEWYDITSGTSIRTGYHSKKIGSTITVMISANGKFKAGIIEPDGARRYTNSSSNMVSHTFNINKKGNHAVYVQNTGSSKITVAGVIVY